MVNSYASLVATVGWSSYQLKSVKLKFDLKIWIPLNMPVKENACFWFFIHNDWLKFVAIYIVFHFIWINFFMGMDGEQESLTLYIRC
jgi:hypothetical protein